MENTSAPRRTGSCWQSVTLQVTELQVSPQLILSVSPPEPALLLPSSPLLLSSSLHPPGEDERLTLKLINRPMLILRGENGFIRHHRKSNTLDASRSIYDIFSLQFSNGSYHIKGRLTTCLISSGALVSCWQHRRDTDTPCA